MIGTVRINGRISAGVISVTDSSVLRGDGCFEVLRAYGGKPFALSAHLDRLSNSAKLMDIELPDLDLVSEWVLLSAIEGGDCAVRVLVTRGSAIPGEPSAPKVIVFSHEWSAAPRSRLKSVLAPWHPSGAGWELAGAKILSYAPNMSASRSAKAAGFDDALLLNQDAEVLEGPTFSIAWVIDGSIETPGLEMGILDSITRRVVMDLAGEAQLDVYESRWPVSRLETASEVFSLSTISEVQPILQVDDVSYEAGPIARQLAGAYACLIGSSGVKQED